MKSIAILAVFLLVSCFPAFAETVTLRDRGREVIFGAREVFVEGSLSKDHTCLCSENADVCCNPLFFKDGTFDRIFCTENKPLGDRR